MVVEPAAAVDQGGADVTHGLRLLYVALTRAVSTLLVVLSRPLPSPLWAARPGRGLRRDRP